MLGGYKKGEHFMERKLQKIFIGVDQFHHSKQKDIEMKEEKVYVFMM